MTYLQRRGLRGSRLWERSVSFCQPCLSSFFQPRSLSFSRQSFLCSRQRSLSFSRQWPFSFVRQQSCWFWRKRSLSYSWNAPLGARRCSPTYPPHDGSPKPAHLACWSLGRCRASPARGEVTPRRRGDSGAMSAEPAAERISRAGVVAALLACWARGERCWPSRCRCSSVPCWSTSMAAQGGSCRCSPANTTRRQRTRICTISSSTAQRGRWRQTGASPATSRPDQRRTRFGRLTLTGLAGPAGLRR